MSIIGNTAKLNLTQYTGNSIMPAYLAYYSADMEKIDNAFVANDTVLAEYDSRLDTIELVIETVSTANIDHLTERVDALEQKVETNTEQIASFNDKVDALQVRIASLESSDVIHDSRLTTLENKVTTLEGCCAEVRLDLNGIHATLDEHTTLLAGLRVDIDKNRHDIEANAQDITIIATQAQTNAENINKIFDDIPVDEIIALAEVSTASITAKGLTFGYVKRAGWCKVNIEGTLSEVIEDSVDWNEEIPDGYVPAIGCNSSSVQPWDIINSQFSIELGTDGKISAVVNGDDIAIGTVVKHTTVYPVANS